MSADQNKDDDDDDEPAEEHLAASSDCDQAGLPLSDSSECSCCQCQIQHAGSGQADLAQQISPAEQEKRGSHECARSSAPSSRRPSASGAGPEPSAGPRPADQAPASPPGARSQEPAERPESDEERQERELALTKRRYVLAELVHTERDYVADLGKLVEGYLVEIRRQLVDCGVDDILTTGVVVPSSAGDQAAGAHQAGLSQQQTGGDQEQPAPGPASADQQLQAGANQPAPSSKWPPLPDALKDGKHKIIFGNIEAIYEFHRDHFLLELERCLEEPHRLGPLFKRYERRLNMYVVYCQNKPRSEAIVSEYLDSYFEELRIRLGHKLQLPDLLIKPVQRIMKYQLLLKDILRYTERAQLNKERLDLMKAVEIMLVVPKSADDMMNVGRLNGFPGKLTAQGKLIKQGILLFCDITPALASLDQAELLTHFEARQAKLRQQHERASQFQLSRHASRRATELASCGPSVGGQLQQQQQQQTDKNETDSCKESKDSSAAPLERDNRTLSTQLIGSSQMNDHLRLALNQLLSSSSHIKLRERQTFLFEQTIIFSEISRKSQPSSSSSAPNSCHPSLHSSSSAASGGAGATGGPAAGLQGAAGIGAGLGSPGQASSGGAHLAPAGSGRRLAGLFGRQVGASANPTANSNNHHPCYPHSHNALGAIESCCNLADCNLAQSSSEQQCDRLPSSALRLLTSSYEPEPLPAAEGDQPQVAKQRRDSVQGSPAFVVPLLAGADAHHHHLHLSAPQYYSMPSYEYKNHLSINKVALIDKHYGPSTDASDLVRLLGACLDPDQESRRFMLKSRDPSQENVIYLLQTGCAFDRDDWVCSIRSMLECQLDFLRALQSPIAYQRGLNKEGSTPSEFSSLWNPELRKTLSNPTAHKGAQGGAGSACALSACASSTGSAKFHTKRIPGLFSQSVGERTGSVKVSLSSMNQSQTAGSQPTASTAASGNAKYLRYVRSKLSKSRLNSVLSLTVGKQDSLSCSPMGTGSGASKQATADAEGQSELAADKVHGELVKRLECKQELVSSSEQVRCESHLTTSESLTPPEPSEPGDAAALPPNPASSQVIKKSSNFFQGFRSTLKGRRGSKQVGQLQAKQDEPAQQVEPESELSCLQQSQSLSSISSGQQAGNSIMSTSSRLSSAFGASKKFRHKLLHGVVGQPGQQQAPGGQHELLIACTSSSVTTSTWTSSSESSRSRK